jgi:hypothetical protein
MSYRMSMTGAQGTGKSTLAQAIAERLSAQGVTGVQLRRGAGDHVTAVGFLTGQRANAEGVRAFARLHFEREAEAGGVAIVFDRCLLDTLAYATVLDCLPTDEYKTLRQSTVKSCSRMDQLLWLRVTTDYPVTSPRDETPEFRRAIDAAIGRLAADNGIALSEHRVPPESIDEIADRSVRACCAKMLELR